MKLQYFFETVTLHNVYHCYKSSPLVLFFSLQLISTLAHLLSAAVCSKIALYYQSDAGRK